MERVTGIGGVFIRSKDPKAMAAWYQRHLGIEFGDGSYFNFEWSKKGSTVFSFFKADSKYFDPSTSSFMVNLRVQNLAELLKNLEKEGVTVVGELQDTEYGKFGWILDPEGNKVELWEPVEEKS